MYSGLRARVMISRIALLCHISLLLVALDVGAYDLGTTNFSRDYRQRCRNRAQQNFVESSIMEGSHSQRGEVRVGTDPGIGRAQQSPTASRNNSNNSNDGS